MRPTPTASPSTACSGPSRSSARRSARGSREDVTLRREALGPDADVVVVEVRATLPILGWLGPDRALTVRGRAFDEATG